MLNLIIQFIFVVTVRIIKSKFAHFIVYCSTALAVIDFGWRSILLWLFLYILMLSFALQFFSAMTCSIRSQRKKNVQTMTRTDRQQLNGFEILASCFLSTISFEIKTTQKERTCHWFCSFLWLVKFRRGPFGHRYEDFAIDKSKLFRYERHFDSMKRWLMVCTHWIRSMSRMNCYCWYRLRPLAICCRVFRLFSCRWLQIIVGIVQKEEKKITHFKCKIQLRRRASCSAPKLEKRVDFHCSCAANWFLQ